MHVISEKNEVDVQLGKIANKPSLYGSYVCAVCIWAFIEEVNNPPFWTNQSERDNTTSIQSNQINPIYFLLFFITLKILNTMNNQI